MSENAGGTSTGPGTPSRIEIDLGGPHIVDHIILYTVGRSSQYVHWPSMWLGVLLTSLLLGLWCFLSWADSIFPVPTAHSGPITVEMDGAEPPVADQLVVLPPVAEIVSSEPAIVAPAPLHLWITVYGPPQFPESNRVARWPLTVQEALDWAAALGLDGICAASPDTPWYRRVRDDMPPILHVDGHGQYLCVDRTARWLRSTIDLWVADPWPGGTYFRERCDVREEN